MPLQHDNSRQQTKIQDIKSDMISVVYNAALYSYVFSPVWGGGIKLNILELLSSNNNITTLLLLFLKH